jgi:SAM-dependent methyltransferase
VPSHGAHEHPAPAAVQFVLGALPPPPARVLDVGCGDGDLARALASAGFDVLGIDPQAPEGEIFRRIPIEELGDVGLFDAVVATYSLHHIDELETAVGRIARLLGPGGSLIVEEFGWDRVDAPTAEWYGHLGDRGDAESALRDWRTEHEGLHGELELRRALDRHFSEHSFEWRPYLSVSLGRADLEAAEREAIERDEIRAVGFRYVGLVREPFSPESSGGDP